MGMFREGCLDTVRMEMKGCGDSEILHGLGHVILYTNYFMIFRFSCSLSNKVL